MELPTSSCKGWSCSATDWVQTWWPAPTTLVGSPTAGRTGFLIEKSHSVSTLASSIYGQDFPCPQRPATYNTFQSKQPHPRQPPPMATSMTHRNLLMASFINGITYLGQPHGGPMVSSHSAFSSMPHLLSAALGKPPPDVLCQSQKWPCLGPRGYGFCDPQMAYCYQGKVRGQNATS